MIDTTFDVRTDAGGRDPDAYSPTLRRYHLRLWSKPLPGGAVFALTAGRPQSYLYHHSDLGEFHLASDTVVTTLTSWAGLRHLAEDLPPAETEAFLAVAYTIGGMMVFPGNKVDGKQTINGARGFNRRIADRMDLTLECIRRHYMQVDSPLSAVLDRYADFFRLFHDFGGYVDFFLLQDLVTEDRDQVRFFTTFADFTTPALPRDLPTYLTFRRRSIEFVHARNHRITLWDATH